ncbi:MAG: LysR substrate-binding domain-containing protein [Hyphomicrobiales bacterium]
MPLRFTLRQLEYFAAVAQAGSIAAASERVNVSSPSISTAIAQLEAEFGLQLFVRKHAHGLSLTPGGARVLAQANLVLKGAGELLTLAHDVTAQVRGPLNVGCLLTFAQIVLPQLRRRFVGDHPLVEFRQYEEAQTGLIEGLRNATLDVALTYDLGIPADLRFTPLMALPPHALVAEDHPLAGAKSVTARDLAGLPMVLLDLPMSADYFLSFFARVKGRPHIVERTRDMAVMQSLVANGIGYSLANVRPLSGRAPDGRKLRVIPLSGLRPLHLGLLQARGARPSLTVKTFTDLCRNMITPAMPGLGGD